MLGVQWLEQLGLVMCNWQKMTMEFQWEDQEHKLQGSNSQTMVETFKKSKEGHG